MSFTAPRPSHRGHIPPVTLKLRRSLTSWPARVVVTAPLPLIEATLNENACAEPTWGRPSRLKRMRSMALASVAVPTVERGSAPIRCWSTMIAVVSPSRTSTSGRAREGMKPCTNALYVSLISRCDSAATVSKTSELLPEPGHPGEDGEAPLGDLEADVAQVVHPGAHHADDVVGARGETSARRVSVAVLTAAPRGPGLAGEYDAPDRRT